ncbi:MAG: HEAT repeat domain-containing protein [Pseudomonadota bacterium]
MPFFIDRADRKVADAIIDLFLRNGSISGQDIKYIEILEDVSPLEHMPERAASLIASSYSDGYIEKAEFDKITNKYGSYYINSVLNNLGKVAFEMDRKMRAVPGLVRDLLTNSASETRTFAAQRLEVIGWEMGSEEALPSLRKIIDNEIVPALAYALERDPDLAVQKAAASALRIMPSDKVKEDAVPGLKRAIQSEDSDLRCKAIYVFGHIGSMDHIPLLLESLDDDDARVREAAAFALGQIGRPMWNGNLAFQYAPYLNSVCTTAASWHSLVVGFCADEVTAALAKVVKNDPDLRVRLEAAHALGEMKSEWSVAPLAYAMLNDPSEMVRDTAAEELGDLDTDKSIRILLDTLFGNNQRLDRRLAAVRGLGRSSLRKADTALIFVLENDPDPSVRAVAADVLGDNDAYAAVATLTHVRDNDPNKSVRSAASRALKFIN